MARGVAADCCCCQGFQGCCCCCCSAATPTAPTVTFTDWGWTSLKFAVKAWCAGDTTTNGDIANWDVSQVTDMNELFCTSATRCSDPVQGDCNPNISKWNTANVISMYDMFYGASAFNQAIGNWNTAKVTSMWRMFYGASAFNQKLCWPHNDTFPDQYAMWDYSKVGGWGTGTPANCT
jgi:surface protein